MDFPGYKIDDEMIAEAEDSDSDEENDQYTEDNHVDMHQQGSTERYVCDTCERDFQTYWQHQKHMSEHRTCGIDGCTFTAHEKIIEKHVRMQHSSGLYDRIRNVITPEDISKWVDERKKKYPKKENIDRRYKQQEEMLKRGEKLQRNPSRFDKNNKTRFSLNRQSNARQHPYNKKGPSKRRMAQQQQKHKPISLIDDKSDWNGALHPFKGTSQLYHKEPAESLNDFDDAEWSEEVPSTAAKKNVLKNALGALMSAYNSDSDSEVEDLVPKNEIARPQAEVHKQNNQNTKQTMVEKVKDVNLSEDIKTIAPKEDGVGVLITDDAAPTEQKIPQLEVPIINNLSDDEAPTEEKIERFDILPEQSTQTSNHNKRTRKRKRVNRKVSNNFKQQHGAGYNANRQHGNKKDIYKKRRVTLLERLLANEITHERNVLLQCVRYVVTNGFFDGKVDESKEEDVKSQKTSDCIMENVNISVASSSKTNVL